MTDRPLAFLSHSSQDKVFALHFKRVLEQAFSQSQLSIFASSSSDAIGITEEWRQKIHEELAAAKYLFVLWTPSAMKSAWISYEVGYFARGGDINNIFVLFHPDANAFSPIDHRQAKSITDHDELAAFLDKLGRVLGAPPQYSDDVVNLANDARSLIDVAPPIPERSLIHFQHMMRHTLEQELPWERVITRRPAYLGEIIDYLEHRGKSDLIPDPSQMSQNWSEHTYQQTIEDRNMDKPDIRNIPILDDTWICPLDSNLQIRKDYSSARHILEPWVINAKRSDDRPERYVVELIMSNAVVKQMYFVAFDNGSTFVPAPFVYSSPYKMKDEYFYLHNSAEYLVHRIVGRVDATRFTDFYAFAKLAEIEVVTDQSYLPR